jgi:NAD(P)-dependent dehydrogenase (short-subunit alcohol dehydrogenase family)
MGQKEQLSNAVLEQTKQEFLVDTLSVNRAALLTGALGGNIGGAINSILSKELHMPTRMFDQRCMDQSLRFDVCDEGDISMMLDSFFTWYPMGDVLVLCHGDMDLKWFEDMSDQDIDYLIETNLISHMKIIRRWVNLTLHKAYKKYIVIIGSMAYTSVLNGSTTYCVAKAGLAMLVRSLAWELAPKNYNVIGIHPSNTLDTPMTERTIQKIEEFRSISREAAEAYWSAVLPKNSFLTKEEIGRHVAHFCSGDADYLSGSNIELRGGQR